MKRLLLLGLIAVGCNSSQGRVRPPGYSDSAGADAVAAYDRNKDGALSGEELDKVPALKAAQAQIDLDGDRKITAAEIDARVANWRDTKIAEMPVRCKVMLDGEPLVGAVVTFEPVAFLGSGVAAGEGTTSSKGYAGISMPADRLADARYGAMACGWYTIRVTSPSQAIPKVYNSASMLGCEVAMDAAWISDGEVLLALKSQP
jgi:hypothetical protein